MKNLFLWYLPQAALFGGTMWFLIVDGANKGEKPNIAAMLIVAVMVAAAYTGGVNLIMSIAARLRRNRAKPGTDSDSLGAGRGLLSEGSKHTQSVRIGKDTR